MTTRTFAPVLPVEARRRLWDRVWRVLLAPPAPEKPADSDSNADAPAERE